MSFNNPIYLWGFIGILIPIAIHLWNKKEGKTVKIGSVKLLNESTSKKSSSIQFNEVLLVLIRILLLSVLVLIAAGPQVQGAYKNKSTTYIIEPSLLDHDKVTKILDTISSTSTTRLLQSGLPEFQKNEVSDLKNSTPNYWQLTTEMEALKSDTIVVFTRGLLAGIYGKRPISHKNISWIVINDDNTDKKWIRAIRKKDSIALLSAVSNTTTMYFDKKVVEKDNNQFELNTQKDSIRFKGQSETYMIRVDTIDTIGIAIFYDQNLKDQVPFIEAVSNTVTTYLKRSVQIDKYQTNEIPNEHPYDLIVWLRKDSLPTTTTKRIMFQPDPLANQLIESSDAKNLFFLTQKLTIANSIDNHFSEQFLEVLALNQKVEERIVEVDKRSISETDLVPIQGDIKSLETNAQRYSSISNWLWLFICLVLFLERIIAKYRKQ